MLYYPKLVSRLIRTALRRGPVLYCAEAVDQTAPVHRMTLPREGALSAGFRADLLGGVAVVSASAETPMSRSAVWAR